MIIIEWWNAGDDDVSDPTDRGASRTSSLMARLWAERPTKSIPVNDNDIPNGFAIGLVGE